MRERGWISRSALAGISRSMLMAAGVCGAVLLTACGGDPGPGTTASTGSATTSAAPATTGAPTTTLQVNDGVAQRLCDMMAPELSNWRIQGPTIGRLGLNAMVHEWALTNGAINAQVLADKGVVDRTLMAKCPQVRTDALQALELTELSAGLAF